MKIDSASIISALGIFTVLFCFSHSASTKSNFIVPEPREISFNEGKFSIDYKETVVIFPKNDPQNYLLEAEQIKAEYQKITGGEPALKGMKKLTIQLTLSKNEKKIGSEGYRLIVKPEKIILTATTRAGLFYAVQTFKQLLRAHANKGFIPALTITDWPTLSFRGVMDDISRGPVPALHFIKHQIRRLSELKFNHLSYYSEHIIRTKNHPEFSPSDGSISSKEWKEISQFAEQYHIKLVGNFQSFGHFSKILSHPKFRPLGEADRMISPVLPQSKEFLKEVLDEVIPAFNAPYFNINSDETYDLGRDYSKQSVEKNGKGTTYAAHIKWLHSQLKKHGVRMMLWADIIAKHPETLNLIPKDTIMLPWNYDAQADFSGMIKPLQDAKYDVIVTPGILNSYRIMPHFEQTRQNLHKFIGAGSRHNVLGSWTTVWDDGDMALFTHDWYGLAFAADQNWNPSASVNKANFENRLLRGIYGTEDMSFIKGLDQLALLSTLKPIDGYKDSLLWRNTIPLRGETARVDLSDWQVVLNISQKANSFFSTAPLLYYPEDAEVFAYTSSLFKTLARTRLWLFNAATQYSAASRNQLSNPLRARKNLVDAIENLNIVAGAWRTLHDRYEILWLKENRSYALNNVLDKYQTHIQSWQNAHSRTKRALRDFDMGQILPAPNDVRLAVETLSGQYFKGWLELGDFPIEPSVPALDFDFLAEAKGENAARPKVTEAVISRARKYQWHRIMPNSPAVVDLVGLNPNAHNHSVNYEFAELTSPDSRLVKATIGSTGSVKIMLNGKPVYQHKGERPLIIDEDSVLLSLKAGKNYLMLKTIRHGGEWKFSFNLPNSRISAHKNRYTILD